MANDRYRLFVVSGIALLMYEIALLLSDIALHLFDIAFLLSTIT